MTDKEMLSKCLDILEQWLDGESPYQETKAIADLIAKRFAHRKPTYKPELTPKYEHAKLLVEAGFMIKEACASAGLTTDSGTDGSVWKRQGLIVSVESITRRRDECL